jgi:hypothetical protein
LPPEPRDAPKDDDDELKGISYHGYFQQRFYGWLVMRNYPRIQHVTLREFYARKTKVRKATLSRSKMADVEAELAILAEQFDLAVMSGPPAEPLELGRMGRWAPSPGKHCGFCLKPGRCPIDEDARVASDALGSALRGVHAGRVGSRRASGGRGSRRGDA